MHSQTAWNDVPTEQDRKVLAQTGHGQRAGYGDRLGLLLVDVNYNFCGDRPEPVLESIQRWRGSCGEQAWTAARNIRRLLDAAHDAAIPVWYTTGDDNADPAVWARKSSRYLEDIGRPVSGNTLLPEVAPRDGENAKVLTKEMPSAFFGTGLADDMRSRGIDTVIVAGMTTSGCVRATVVDAFSHGFRVAVVQECTADRLESSHLTALFDMNLKYADVVGIDEVLGQLQGEGALDQAIE